MSRRMFEMVEGTSNKFWEVWQEDTVVHTRYGRLGTTGQSTEKDEGTAEKARKLHDKLVAEKLKKGYVEKGGAPKVAGPKAVPSKVTLPPFDREKAAARIAKIEAAAARAGVKLPPGAPEAAIAATEAKLGVTFPHEVRAFYLAHDGGPDDEVCGGRQLLSLSSILTQWKIWKQLFDDGELEDEGAEPDTGVRAKWWIPEWIPLTHDFGGNHDVVDLSPAKRGKYGQMISFWHDEGSRTVEGDDFLTWLEDQKWGDSDDEEEDSAAGPYLLSEPSPWKAGPYAFVFQLGKNARAGKTRVPTVYTSSPCYFYRADKRAFGKALSKIPEPDVAEADVDVTFAAIDGYVSENMLRRELYTDAEIEAKGAHSETRGFHAGASYEECKAALTKGGFNVIDLLGPTGLGRDVDELARHLDLTSVALLHKSLREEASDLVHGGGAGQVLTRMIEGGHTDAFLKAVRAAAPTWTRDMLEALSLVAAHAWLRHAKYACGGLSSEAGKVTLLALRTLLEALPPVEDKESRQRLAAWGLLKEGAELPLPKDLPRSIPEALALVDATGLAVVRGKPVKPPKSPALPDALQQVYKLLSNLGRRTILFPSKHGDLRAELTSAIRAAEDCDSVAEDDLDAASLSAPEALVPFGKDSGGDPFFLDPAYVVDGELPVLRFVHDEGRTCRVEASSLGSFIAGRGLLDAYGIGLRGDAVDALIRRDRKLVPLPLRPPATPTPSPAARPVAKRARRV